MGENELCKVADFGLLRELPKDDSIYHSQTNVPCPVRWMPPEAVTDRAFSTASDVWSFGILQWEMFHPGKLPYEKFSNLECVTKVEYACSHFIAAQLLKRLRFGLNTCSYRGTR